MLVMLLFPARSGVCREEEDEDEDENEEDGLLVPPLIEGDIIKTSSPLAWSSFSAPWLSDVITASASKALRDASGNIASHEREARAIFPNASMA
jgi:hypothetical protein